MKSEGGLKEGCLQASKVRQKGCCNEQFEDYRGPSSGGRGSGGSQDVSCLSWSPNPETLPTFSSPKVKILTQMLPWII